MLEMELTELEERCAGGSGVGGMGRVSAGEGDESVRGGTVSADSSASDAGPGSESLSDASGTALRGVGVVRVKVGEVGLDNECVGFSRGSEEREPVLGRLIGEVARGGSGGAVEVLLVDLGGDTGVGEADASLTGRLAWRRSRVLKFLV